VKGFIRKPGRDGWDGRPEVKMPAGWVRRPTGRKNFACWRQWGPDWRANAGGRFFCAFGAFPPATNSICAVGTDCVGDLLGGPPGLSQIYVTPDPLGEGPGVWWLILARIRI